MTSSNPELAKYSANDVDPELTLLGDEAETVNLGFSSSSEGLRNAPVFTGDALLSAAGDAFPQRALYGRVIAQQATGFPTTANSPKLYINTNTPWSGIVCGLQGSGKSHSTSVILESCLIRDSRLGTLPEPLSTLLFYFDTAAGGGHVQPCEAAYLASLDSVRGGNATAPKVTVLVLPNTLHLMRRVYAKLPGVKVEPLHFSPSEISGERLLSMMKVDHEQQMPLYMESIMRILRDTHESRFNYDEFRYQLQGLALSRSQKMMLDLRLSLLDSCLSGGDSSNGVSKQFRKGQLTIVDLSSPFMDGSSACSFFDIVLGVFIETKTDACGKLVVLDEAHKYLTGAGSSCRLTDSLLSVVRQQRHLAARVLISTQEPNVIPANFLDLCSFVIAHRFSSPSWLNYLKQHVLAGDGEWFSKVVSLKTGEAIMFAPAGIGLRLEPHGQEEGSAVTPFGKGYLLVRSRQRITKDGGFSLLAVPDSPVSNSRKRAISPNWRR